MYLIEERLTRLERSARRWKSAAITLLVAVAVSVSLGMVGAESGTIEAKRIVFRDDAGLIRMELRSAPAEGNARPWWGLMFYNDAGEEAARVRLSGNSPLIQMKGSSKDALETAESVIERQKGLSEDVKAVMRTVAKANGETLVVVEPGTLASYGKDQSATVIGGGYGGGITVKDEPKATAAAVMGRVQTVNDRTGASTNHAAATFTIFNSSGKVVHQVP